jgi:hypothetical protein
MNLIMTFCQMPEVTATGSMDMGLPAWRQRYDAWVRDGRMDQFWQAPKTRSKAVISARCKSERAPLHAYKE